MMNRYFKPQQQGIAMMVCGVLLFLYTIGIFSRMLTAVVIVAAILLIVYGATLSGVSQRVIEWANRNKKR